MNRTLAIAIPTYNRPDLLRRSLASILPEVRRLSVPVHISDDSTSNETAVVVEEFRREYSHIVYRHNDPRLGHDRNLFGTLSLPQTDYVWLLGDALTIAPGAVAQALDIIARLRPDIIGVNAAHRDIDIASSYYADRNEVLNTFGWHLTLTGTTIYGKRAVATVPTVDLERFRNFGEFALIFTCLATACSFYWNNSRCVSPVGPKMSYWTVNLLATFIDDWAAAVRALPESYDAHIEERVIIEHSKRSRIFEARSLLGAREFDGYDLRLFRKYRLSLRVHSDLSQLVLFLIACTPKVVVRVARQIL